MRKQGMFAELLLGTRTMWFWRKMVLSMFLHKANKISRKIINIFTLCLMGLGCLEPPNERCDNFSYNNFYDVYEVTPDKWTHDGYHVDTSGTDVDLNKIDEIIQKTTECLENTYNRNYIPQETAERSWCRTYDSDGNKITKMRPLDHCCFSVKIDAEWHWSQDGTQQLLSQKAPERACQAKGYNSDCYWRTGIQPVPYGAAIIVTPNLNLFSESLLRYITSCENIWVDEILRECYIPSN